MPMVSIRETRSYDENALRAAVDEHFERLGIDGDLRPGMRVLIKPNLLGAHRPQQAATTHPALVAAIARWLRGRGIYDITIADSPGGTYRRGYLNSVYDACGYRLLDGIAALNNDTGYQSVSCPEGFLSSSFNIINPVVQADYIINVAKLKTHALATMTAGVKNLFGVVPGLQKPEWHLKFSAVDDFSRLLIELASLVAPQVTVIDAVEAMEGNGPLNGRVRQMNLTLSSRDVFAQDYIAASLMGLEPEEVPIVRMAIKMGLINPADIQTAGFDAKPADPSFVLPESITSGGSRNFLMRTVSGILKRIYCPVPGIDTDKCIGCGKCAESCPMQLIEIKDKKAGMSVKHCISCFCCQEMCPMDAVRVRHVLRMPKV